MTQWDYGLVGILAFSYFLSTRRRGLLVREGILWACSWVAAVRLAFLTGQGYTRFLATDAYRFNHGKQEEPWVAGLVLCSAGVLLLVVSPVVRFFHQWRTRREAT